MLRKNITVNFVDFSKDFDKENNDFMEILQRYYNVELSEDPEYLFYSVFGYSHMRYDCVKIFYTGECIVPDFNICDYAIGFEHMEYGDRYIRIPLYQLFQYKTALEMAVNKRTELSSNRKFCSFVVSNDQGMPERKQIFDLLSKYKRVDSGGKYLNNVGGPVADKYAFDREHKFSIVFENCISNGYTTEKIIQAFAAGTIPIYYGDPTIKEVFNSRAFVNCADFCSLEEAVTRVIEIDNDENEYDWMCSEPAFLGDPPTLEPLERFLTHIVDQPLHQARRRPHNTRISERERNIHIISVYDKIIGIPLKRFSSLLRRLRNGAM